MKKITPKLMQILPSDVIRTEINKITGKNEIYLGENKITEQEFNNLREEVAYITKTRIWSILTNTLGETSRQVMFEKATTFEDMRWGKAILYAIDIQKKIMKIFEKR
jgi:hypothetical protein